MRFLDFLFQRWLEILCLVFVLGFAFTQIHGCVAQDLCEYRGGTLVDRDKDSWSCKRTP